MFFLNIKISSLHAFEIKVNSMKDRTNKFYVYSKEASNFRGIIRRIKFFFLGTFPRFTRILNIKKMLIISQ